MFPFNKLILSALKVAMQCNCTMHTMIIRFIKTISSQHFQQQGLVTRHKFEAV